MPIYDYTCGACGHTVEVIHGVHHDGPRFCPSCGVESRMKKAFHAPTVHFKGSGWAKKDRSATATTARSKGRDVAPASDGASGSTETSTTGGSAGSTDGGSGPEGATSAASTKATEGTGSSGGAGSPGPKTGGE